MPHVRAAVIAAPPLSTTDSCLIMTRKVLVSMTLLAAALPAASPAAAQVASRRPYCDLTVAKRVAGPLVAGKPAKYLITMVNAGTGSCVGPIVLHDVLPAGLSLAGASSGWSCNSGGDCSYTHSKSLPAGSALTVELTVNIAQGAGDTLRNCVSVSHGVLDPVGHDDRADTGLEIREPDPWPAEAESLFLFPIFDVDWRNNRACDCSPVRRYCDLTVTKSHQGNFVKGGQGQFVVTVTNVGAASCQGPIWVYDGVPQGLTLIGSVPAVCTNGTCQLPQSLAPGQSVKLVLTFAVSERAPDLVDNCVRVRNDRRPTGGEEPLPTGSPRDAEAPAGRDYDWSNNSACDCAPTVRCPNWTGWLDRDNAGGVGDFETLKDFLSTGQVHCNHPIAIQCETLSGVPWYQAGEVYRCESDVGGVCVNAQQPDRACQDYQVRFCCPAEP